MELDKLAIVIGITEVLKRTFISEKYAPIVAILVGIAIESLMIKSVDEIVSAILYGTMNGLVATGLYGAGKSITKK
jgi:hypothetical protein